MTPQPTREKLLEAMAARIVRLAISAAQSGARALGGDRQETTTEIIRRVQEALSRALLLIGEKKTPETDAFFREGVKAEEGKQ